MATFPVVLDACVLFNAPVRDTLLRAAEYGAFRVHWSQKILDETTKNLVERKKMNETQAAHLVSEMSKAFPEAMTEVPQSQVDAMRNDPKDRHVAACAVCASAEVICTFNVSDFKPEDLPNTNIEAQNPDQFHCFLFDLSQETMMRVLTEQASDLKEIDLDKLLGLLQKHVPDFVENIKKR